MSRPGVLTIRLEATPGDYIKLAFAAHARGDKVLALACRDGCEARGTDRHAYAYMRLVEGRFIEAFNNAFKACAYGCEEFPSNDDKCSNCRKDD